VSIGSYPSFQHGGFRNQLVLRSREADLLAAAEQDVIAMLARLKADSTPL